MSRDEIVAMIEASLVKSGHPDWRGELHDEHDRLHCPWPYPCLRCRAKYVFDALDAAGLVIVPREPTPEMVADAAPDVSFAEHSDYEIALKAVDLLPPTQHPDVADVLASMVKDYRAMIKAAPK